MNKKAFLNLLLVVFVMILKGCNENAGEPGTQAIRPDSILAVAAASDLKYAMDSIVKAFNSAHPGISIQVNYGSSGKFYQQITRHAPFDLYFSADNSYTEKLASSGLCASNPKVYAIGRIVIFSKLLDTKRGSGILMDGRIRKIAIANPMHAPYGKRAEEALRFYKLYEPLQSKLIMGENIAQAAQFVSSGAAEIGIIAQSLAISPALREEGNYFLIPEAAHSPLQQSFVVLTRAARKTPAFTFSEYITSPEAKQILKGFGFSTPE